MMKIIDAFLTGLVHLFTLGSLLLVGLGIYENNWIFPYALVILMTMIICQLALHLSPSQD